MRVCYLASSLHPSDGWGRYARELLAAAPAAGIEPVLVTARSGAGEPLAQLERYDLLPPVLERRFELPRSLLHAAAVRRVARRCELVHVLVEPWLPLAALAVPRRTPLVQTAHGSWAVHPLRRPLVRRVFARALARTDLLVCQSTMTRDAVHRLAPLRRCEVIAGGVDAARFAGPSGPPPPAWPTGFPVVLSVGALKPRKGHEIALAAFAQAAAEHPDLHWVVIGGRTAGSAYADDLQRRTGELGLGARVHWLTGISDEALVACYRQATVFMLLPVPHAGSFEGLGLVYLEAAAAGVPAVGTHGSGAADAVVDGVTGLLVPPDDAAAAAALTRLIGDPDLRGRLGAAGRAHAAEVSWTRLAGSLAERYRGLVTERRAARGRQP